MNLEYFTLQSFIKDKIADMVIAKKATSIALGISISRMLPIPSTVVDSAESHYAYGLADLTSSYVSTFNEAIVVDVDLVLETARTFWLIRYANAYPNLDAAMLSMGSFGFLTKLAGAGRYINNESFSFCEKYSELMIVLINQITRVVKEKEQV